MLTRVVGEDWRVLEVTDNPYGVNAGDTFEWQSSICSRMVARPSPWLLPDVSADDEAAAAPVRGIADIGAYAGVPLVTDDGLLLGTLCAIDPGTDVNVDISHLLRFAERFASHVLDIEASVVGEQRAAERRLLADESPGPLRVPKGSWNALLDSETTRSIWSGERLVVALARIVEQHGQRRVPIERAAGVVAALLDADDAVAVLGSNRIGLLVVDRTVAAIDALLSEAAAYLERDDVVLQSAVAEVVGPMTALDACDELESLLVGDAAASARTASRRLFYEFCDECGRKGRYRRPATDLVRCKYCGVVGV